MLAADPFSGAWRAAGADPDPIPMTHTKSETHSEADLWKNAKTSDAWFGIVYKALTRCRGPARLAQLYELIERHPKARKRTHWKAKVRQVLEASKMFVRVAPGTWDLASEHSAEAIDAFDRQRRERYRRRKQAKS